MQNKILLTMTEYNEKVKLFNENLKRAQTRTSIRYGGNYGIMTFIVDKLTESGLETNQDKLKLKFNLQEREEYAEKLVSMIEFD